MPRRTLFTTVRFGASTIPLSGHERTVYSSPGMLRLNDISRNGQRVLLTRGARRGAITGLGAGEAKERDLSLFDYSTVADLSSDGKTLVFYEWGEGVGARSTIFIRKTDGGEAADRRGQAARAVARWPMGGCGKRGRATRTRAASDRDR
jgi:hypothetical protein